MNLVTIYKNTSNNFKAILAMILAVFCVTIMSVQAKLVGIEYHAVQITFARAMVVIILLLPLIYKLGGIKFLKTNKPYLHFFRSLAGLTGNIMFFLAFQRLPVADVTVISQAVPIFSCIFCNNLSQRNNRVAKMVSHFNWICWSSNCNKPNWNYS